MLKSARELADFDFSRSNAPPPSTESGFTNIDTNKHSSSADFRVLRPGVNSDLQLADSETDQMDHGSTFTGSEASVCGIFEQATFTDLTALGVELGRATSSVERARPPLLPVTRNPPSYDEALLHKAMRLSDVTGKPVTYQALANHDTTHLLTSSTYGDVTALTSRPPPPYQLRPRRQNYEIHKAWNDTSILPPSNDGIGDVDQSEGHQSRQNRPEVIANNTGDQSPSGLRRSSSFPSPRRRPKADAVQKENVDAVVSTTSVTSRPSSGSQPEPVDMTRKNQRPSVLLKRRSLTVRDRDWHRELVDQYSIAVFSPLVHSQDVDKNP